MLWMSIIGTSTALPLGQGEGHELIYVIAVLILGAVGALADKIKKNKERAEQERTGQAKPSKPRPSDARKAPAPGRGASAEPSPRTGREVSLPRRPREWETGRTAPPAATRPSHPPARPAPAARAPAEAPPKGTMGATLSDRREGLHRTLQAGDSATSSLLARESVRTSGTISGTGTGKGRRRRGIGSSWWLPTGQLTTGELRRAIILSEILQPPIALREE